MSIYFGDFVQGEAKNTWHKQNGWRQRFLLFKNKSLWLMRAML